MMDERKDCNKKGCGHPQPGMVAVPTNAGNGYPCLLIVEGCVRNSTQKGRQQLLPAGYLIVRRATPLTYHLAT
jgi:hypothetical protein